MDKKKTVYFKRSKYRSEDFSINNLPLTRGAQFFDILKNEWKTFLLMGVLLFIFFIPYLTLDVFYWFIRVNLPSQIASTGGDEAAILEAVQFTDILYEVLVIPATLIFIIPIAGISRVLKRLVHGEGLLFKADFLEGIKMNIFHFLILGFIYCALRFTTQFIYIYISYMPLIPEIVRGVTTGVLFILFVPILLFMFAQDSIYKMNLWINFKNSYQLAIKSILIMWIFSFLIFGVYFLSYIQNIILKEGICIILVITIVPLYLLAISLYTMSRFDKYINVDYYQEIYRKGLRPYADTHKTDNL